MKCALVGSLGLSAGVLFGCSASLRTVAVTDPAVFHGIRVRALETYVVKKQYVTEKCPPQTLESIAHLPLGRAYDVSFSGGRLADNQFSVSFGDNGMLKQVTLNSDPQLDESLASAALLTESLAAALGVPSAVPCGATLSESIVEVRPLVVKE
jgi:hypothetical protein